MNWGSVMRGKMKAQIKIDRRVRPFRRAVYHLQEDLKENFVLIVITVSLFALGVLVWVLLNYIQSLFR